jgi:hypothetical protein
MILMMEETQHPWDQRGNQTDHRVEMFATGFPPKAARVKQPTWLESESFPLSGSGGCGCGRGSGGRAGVPGDGLRPVSPGRPPGLRPLARAHSGWPHCRQAQARNSGPGSGFKFKLAGELDLVFQAPAGLVMGQFSYSKVVPQTGQGPRCAPRPRGP